MANVDFNSVITVQRDAISKWAAETERKMKANNIKMSKKANIVQAADCSRFFRLELVIFQKHYGYSSLYDLNVLYTRLHLHLIEASSKKKEENQLVVAIRIFIAEYMQHYQVRKSFCGNIQ